MEQGLTQLLLIGIVLAHGHLKKLLNQGSTVGEIRSRELSGVGTPSYSAFAYGPGSSAINGDIWYTDRHMANSLMREVLITIPLYMKLAMLLV